MKIRLPFGFAILLVSAVQAAEVAPPPRCEPWDHPYSGQDATGEHVLALWQFDAEAETADASGKGHPLTLRGASRADEGRFGGGLRSSPGWPIEDQRHAAVAESHPALSPGGPFTLELWIRPDAELDADYPEAFLLDKKYVAHEDYQLILGTADRGGARTLRACLGFGADSATYHAHPSRFAPGTWYHVAFTYDGAGEGAFYLDGRSWGGGAQPGRKSISPGQHPLSIGDRVGSYFHGFPGAIDQVRISRGVREFRRTRLELLGHRRVFVRMEADQQLTLRLTNLQDLALPAGKVSLSLGGLAERVVELGPLEAGTSLDLTCPLETALRPGEYRLTGRIAAGEVDLEERFPLRIVARRTPHGFPVLMWGLSGDVIDEIPRLKRLGFTHVLGIGADYQRIWEAGAATQAASDEKVRSSWRALDEALAADLTLVASLSPGAALRSREEFRRVGRDGQPLAGRDDICGLFPRLAEHCFHVGASVAATYGEHPAFGAALIHTEVRDHARPCFHEHDRAAFRAAVGGEIPDAVVGPRGVDYRKIDGFSASRVIPDDHPLLAYYRWYWKAGDGWNRLNTEVHRGLHSTGRSDLWTFHDPAVRVASVYGSGGGVDVLSQWTYSYPDPIRIGLATDELLAMAKGAESQQQVMKMTQLIWYRSQTAPPPKDSGERRAYQAEWEQEQPAAPFITISPLHLREAFWTKIARPIRGMMYHGWQSLVPTDSPSSYCYTHPQTGEELQRLVHEVVQPLGPMLQQLPGLAGDVGMLESFAAEMFAGRGTYGWCGGWAGSFEKQVSGFAVAAVAKRRDSTLWRA